jgi:predicted permease
MMIDDRPFTIIGVVPSSFDFPRAETQLWLPLRYTVGTDARYTHNVAVIGRLASGVAFDAAQSEIGEIGRQLEAEYAQSNTGRGASIEPVTDVLFGGIRPALLVLLGAVALVLLIACANVANLLLARGASRTREVAVRAAMGASRGRLTRQFLVEGLVLTLVAAAIGVGLAHLGLDRLLSLVPADLPRADSVGIDGRVLGATIAVSAAVGLLFGMIPAMQSRGVDLQDSLKGEGGRAGTASRARTNFRSVLVVAELALSVMLVIGAGLMIRSFVQLNRIDPGFRPHNLLKAEFQLPDTRYPRDYSRFPNFAEINAFYDRVLEQAKALPGVEAAAIAGQHPLAAGFTNSFVIEGREAEASGQAEIPIRPVSPDYLRTAGLQLVRGRPLETTDRVDAPAVLRFYSLLCHCFCRQKRRETCRTFAWHQVSEVSCPYSKSR